MHNPTSDGNLYTGSVTDSSGTLEYPLGSSVPESPSNSLPPVGSARGLMIIFYNLSFFLP